ncbi:DNA cytosine methyltransferase [cf. Phormidesmis sp. LEGE 11477]|uniref:DNA cytosine methyltransferase n=1 Tax=cf. Phormidesmis sp. LEGE 11477 TaxID=1828680 RepID=UPI00187FF0DE|nr:DNA (cytosine-5-)-methyltransferase [cf. Phormidesmis sp. LEGE 11477]MBE9062728.1 DNA (cytosine-5-)-methyltransferase [cf. Phormidesmis sp. LEGE 11477]
MSEISCVELFSGAGGLAKGIELSGTRHKAFVEWNKDACKTLSYNYKKQIVYNTDVRLIDFKQFGPVDIVSGGPPCQPFSLGGKHKGNTDKRDMFPYVCKAVSVCTPKTFIVENVKGILRKSFSTYFEYIVLRLTYPNVESRKSEDWTEHLRRLEKIHTSKRYNGLKYKVVFRLVDAADYGVPQRRERVFIIGVREDLGVEWVFPEKTHSLEALLWSQFVSGDYWDHHNIEPPKIESLDRRVQKRVLQMQKQLTLFPPPLSPWRTVRDTIGRLPFPDSKGSFNEEHILRKGARTYPGHTGSYVDSPSKTLKAGDHGVPGGENMIRYRDGRVRYYTTFEAKRIQTFPDDYKIFGSWTESMRQIGNAVPVKLGHRIVSSLIQAIR